MATVAIDIPYISNFLSIPQATISNGLQEPTKDFVVAVLEAAIAKAREHDELKADKLRLEVELENVVRTNELRIRSLKGNLEKSLKELEQFKEKFNQEENARSTLERELQLIRSSSSASTSELQTLRSRIASLESSNRDTLSLLESKSAAHDRVAEELSAQHQKTLELRREISSLHQSVQAVQSASTTSKFRESNLQQEIEILKRSNEWHENELKTKAAESSKLRKEKNAKIAELQRQNEDATSTIESLRRTEKTLRAQLEEVSHKADQAFTRIQQLQEDAAKEQESYRKELEGAQRLAELYESSAKSARDRLQEVQTSLERTKDDAVQEANHIRSEAEKERTDKEAAERRIMELEVLVERLEADAANFPNGPSAPGTPQRRLNGTLTPNRDVRGSPGATRLKGNLSFTQMYTEYTNAMKELDMERRRNEKLSATIDEMIQDLESKQPEVEDLKAEHGRLESQILEVTGLLETRNNALDQARKEARKWEGQVQGLQHEGSLLRQQLRDLSAQIKALLVELHSRTEGLEELDPAQKEQLQRVASGELDAETLEGMTDTDQLISQQLTVFKDVHQLQEQNMNLLRVTRELTNRMEGDEAVERQHQHARDHEELEALRIKVEQYKDEIKSMASRSESYVKERDMFRRMLQHRGQLPANADLNSMFGQSVGGTGPTTPLRTSTNTQQSPNAKEIGDLTKLIKDMQTHFDTYREEAATDHRALKEQSTKLSREKAELQAEFARSESQVTLARERFDMLQSNYAMLKTENSELQKRINSLAESAAKQDLRTQQVAEDLVEAKALADGMQNEIANLKAEKDLWKRIENRLSEDNERLLDEKSRLNGLITNLQNLQNEREQSDSETRRKLQSQVENLETELQATKRNLELEIDNSKKAALRKELDSQQNQRSIDDLRNALSGVKEQLIAATTTRDHLQARVDELSIQLRGAEERVSALQLKSSEATSGGGAGGDGSRGNEGEGASSVTREQELSMEVAELKRDLDLAKSELEKAKEQIEQYKSISQASEEELQSLNTTYEQYHDDTDRMIAEKDAKITELEQRVEEITSELSNSHSELSALRTELAERNRVAEEEKSMLDADITRLNDQAERHAAAAKYHQEDLKAQAEIAQQAQQNYEDELVKHAEAAKALQDVRSEYNQLRSQVVQWKTEAEAAKAALSQNETSWEEKKQVYEKELTEMRKRRDDVNSQNNLLHKQLEAVSHEIEALRQRRAASEEGRADESYEQRGTSERSISELREVINFLRRDKEIVDVQYELSVQETKRLRQQLDYTQSQLDEARLKLDQERRSHAEGSSTSMTHNELMEKINQLNLYRESTVTLRNEARQAQAQLVEKAKRLEELMEEVQPLQTKIRELENEKETHQGEIKLLEEDRDRWQQRTQNILQKYDRVDPAELEGLKQQVANLEAEREQLLTEKESLESLREQVDSIPQQIEQVKEEAANSFKDRTDRMVAQFKERSRMLTALKNEKVTECQALAAQKEELERELAESKQEVERAHAERDQVVANGQGHASRDARSPSYSGRAGSHSSGADVSLSNEERQQLEQRIIAAEQLAKERQDTTESLQNELGACRRRFEELEGQVTELRQQLEEANARIMELQSSQTQVPESQDADSMEELEKLRQELVAAQEEIQTLQTNAAISSSINNASADDDSKTFAQQLSEQVEAIKQDLDLRHAERVQQAEDQYKLRAERMKSQLTKKLSDGRDQIRQTLEAEREEALQSLKTEHENEIRRLQAQHEEELERLKREEASRFEQEKQEWVAKQSHDGNVTSGPMSESNLSEPQLRDLAATNPTLQSILRNNISTQIKKVREEQERVLEEKIQEMNAKCAREKEQAIAMERQRQKVKLSMAENKARALGAKTDIVQQAATDTPQRPVGEVWDLAKDAKPLPAPPAQTGTETVQAPPKPTSIPQTSPVATSQQEAPQTQTTSATVIASQAQQEAPSASTIPWGGLSPPKEMASPVQSMQPAALSEQPQGISQRIQAPLNQNQQQIGSALPPRPPQGMPISNVGTGPAALRNIIGQGQSMLPRPPPPVGRAGRGANAHQNNQAQVHQPENSPKRQNSNPRGQQQGGSRGRSRGYQRGGNNHFQQHQTDGAFDVQEREGPDFGNNPLNAAAAQFFPGGNKRQREDGADEEGVGRGNAAGKRQRGR